MNFDALFACAPLGACVRFSDGTPKPPAAHNKKLLTWERSNGEGMVVHKDQGRSGPATIALEMKVYRSRAGVACIRFRQIHVAGSRLDYEILSVQPDGAVLSTSSHAGSRELHTCYPDIAAAQTDNPGRTMNFYQIVKGGEPTPLYPGVLADHGLLSAGEGTTMSCAIVQPAVIDDVVALIGMISNLPEAVRGDFPLFMGHQSPTLLGRALLAANVSAFRRRYDDRHEDFWAIDVDAYCFESSIGDDAQRFTSLAALGHQLSEDETIGTELYVSLGRANMILASALYETQSLSLARSKARNAGGEWLRRDGRDHHRQDQPVLSAPEPIVSTFVPPKAEVPMITAHASNVRTPLTVPVSKLDHSPLNARSTERYQGDAAIPELAASLLETQIHKILAHPGPNDGEYLVFAGGRRLEGYRRNIAEGLQPADQCADIEVWTNLDLARVVSLEENFHRADMHPLDEASAFDALIEQGAGIEAIAARFGKPARYIRQRRRLARLAEKVAAAFHAGRIDLPAAEAYAATEDGDRQTAVFDELDRAGRVAHVPDEIRRRLQSKGVPAGHKLARFVGRDTYVRAGGLLDEDLFTPEADAIFRDEPLLNNLADEKFKEAMASMTAVRGFADVRIYDGWGPKHDDLKGLAKVEVELRDRTDAETLEFTRLSRVREEAKQALDTALANVPQHMTAADRASLAAMKDASDAAAAALVAFEAQFEMPVDETGLIAFISLADTGTITAPRVYRRKEPAAMVAVADAPEVTEVKTVSPSSFAAPVEHSKTRVAAEMLYGPTDADPDSLEPGVALATKTAAATTSEAVPSAGPSHVANFTGPLACDLAFERTAVLKDAIADNPMLSFDLLIFSLAMGMFGSDDTIVASIGMGLKVTAQRPAHAGPRQQEFDGRQGLLEGDFLQEETPADAFRVFTSMSEASRLEWAGYVTAASLQPSLAWPDEKGSLASAFEGGSKRVDQAASFHNMLAERLQLKLRDRWQPTEIGLARMKRPDLDAAVLAIAGPAMARSLRDASVSDIARLLEQICAGRGHAGPGVMARALAWTPFGMGFPADNDAMTETPLPVLETAEV